MSQKENPTLVEKDSDTPVVVEVTQKPCWKTIAAVSGVVLASSLLLVLAGRALETSTEDETPDEPETTEV